jgi:hypothetical protein
MENVSKKYKLSDDDYVDSDEDKLEFVDHSDGDRHSTHSGQTWVINHSLNSIIYLGRLSVENIEPMSNALISDMLMKEWSMISHWKCFISLTLLRF